MKRNLPKNTRVEVVRDWASDVPGAVIVRGETGLASFRLCLQLPDLIDAITAYRQRRDYKHRHITVKGREFDLRSDRDGTFRLRLPSDVVDKVSTQTARLHNEGGTW